MNNLDQMWAFVLRSAQAKTPDAFAQGRYQAAVYMYALATGTSMESVENRISVELRRNS